jgi:hypothetical protein
LKTIYIVEGTTGECSDRREWQIRAFLSKKKANALQALASKRAKELFTEYDKYYHIPRGANEFDPEMRADYTGVRYVVYSLELDEG